MDVIRCFVKIITITTLVFLPVMLYGNIEQYSFKGEKKVVALEILKLEERHKVNLIDHATNYLSYIKTKYTAKTTRLTLQNLIQQTIGIYNKKNGIYASSNVDNNSTIRTGEGFLDVFTYQKVNLPDEKRFDYDQLFSFICIGLGVAIFLLLLFLSYIVFGVLRKKRKPVFFTKRHIIALMLILFLYSCIGFGVYLFPQIAENISFDLALAIFPASFKIGCVLLLTAFTFSMIVFAVAMLFPHQSKIINKLPVLVLLGLIAGITNASMVFIITNSIFNKQHMAYLLCAFVFVLVVYLFSSKVGRTATIKLTNDTVVDLRMKIFNLIFKTSYFQFEKTDRGRIFTVLTDDINTVSGNIFATIRNISSVITVVMIFIYLGTISLWADLALLGLLIGYVIIAYLVAEKHEQYFQKVWVTSTNFMSLLDGLLNGFKEIILHRNKSIQYRNDISSVTDDYCRINSTANIKFTNLNLMTESAIILVMAFICFAFPVIFPEMKSSILVNFIMILLYIIAPMTAIMDSLPDMLRLKVSWNRIQQFMRDIPETPNAVIRGAVSVDNSVESIMVESVTFSYEKMNDEQPFIVGPINFMAKKGEIIFIIGGNGSGKTTFAKILTGLYPHYQGKVTINGLPVTTNDLGEYFSVVFADYYIFKKLYEVNTADKKAMIDTLLGIFHLESKVKIENNSFSTIDLSGGQRKRLALLRCYLEDKPIFLFDEVAADQDPEFRKYFYKSLLPEMKQKGKIVIAITHDDHYFDVADKIMKFDMGRIEYIKGYEDLA
jgi:putative ATP-binding cassette transporter